MSIKVRTTAPSISNGQAVNTATTGASQRKPENHAMTRQAVYSCSTPMGCTRLRSRMRAQSSVSDRIGKVISHSRSQSDFASSPDATTTSRDDSQNISSRKATPTTSSELKATVSQNVSGGSSAKCRLRSD